MAPSSRSRPAPYAPNGLPGGSSPGVPRSKGMFRICTALHLFAIVFTARAPVRTGQKAYGFDACARSARRPALGQTPKLNTEGRSVVLWPQGAVTWLSVRL